MIYRVASPEQLNNRHLHVLGQKFFDESKSSGKLNWEHVKGNMIAMLVSGTGAIWIAEEASRPVGIIGGLITPHFFTGDPVAIETFWYVDPDHRTGTIGPRLKKQYEDWALNLEVQEIHMSRIHGIQDEKMHDYYVKTGYPPYETVYRKIV